MKWWQVLHPGAKIGFDNSPYLSVAFWPFVRDNGTAGLQSRVRLWDGACAVALDAQSHELYVVKQTRETESGHITTIEVPGGGIDEGDTPLECAKKELFEEAGVVAEADADWIRLYGERGMQPIDGLVITSQHAFLALRTKQIAKPSDGDTREVMTIPLSEIIAMDNYGEFNDPLFPYAVRRAHDWLAENLPDFLT